MHRHMHRHRHIQICRHTDTHTQTPHRPTDIQTCTEATQTYRHTGRSGINSHAHRYVGRQAQRRRHRQTHRQEITRGVYALAQLMTVGVVHW